MWYCPFRALRLLHGRVKQDRPVADVSDRRDPVAENIRMFLGEWLDNLGHKIVVTPASQRFGRNPRGRPALGPSAADRYMEFAHHSVMN